MTTESEEHWQMVQDCETRESKLSEWERSFIDSVGKQLADDKTLSPKQIETLDKIWERVT